MSDKDGFYLVTIDEALELFRAAETSVDRAMLEADHARNAPISLDAKWDLFAYIAWLLGNG